MARGHVFLPERRATGRRPFSGPAYGRGQRFKFHLVPDRWQLVLLRPLRALPTGHRRGTIRCGYESRAFHRTVLVDEARAVREDLACSHPHDELRLGIALHQLVALVYAGRPLSRSLRPRSKSMKSIPTLGLTRTLAADRYIPLPS